MKSGNCSKCGARSVFYKPGHHLQSEKVTLKSGMISSGAVPDRYICVSCGYVEFYLSAEQDLQTVRETWEAVIPKNA